MSQRKKKTAGLRSVEERRHSPQQKRARKPADTADRHLIRQALAPHDIDAATKKRIEDLAVEYGPALNRLADR